MARRRGSVIVRGRGRMAPGWWWKKKREAAANAGPFLVDLGDGQWAVSETGPADGYLVDMGGGQYAIDTGASSGLSLSIVDGQVFAETGA